jgi:hypothetical protein
MYKAGTLSNNQYYFMNGVEGWAVTVQLTADFLAHSILVIKYWVISQKVAQIMKNEQDKYLDCKANFIFYG